MTFEGRSLDWSVACTWSRDTCRFDAALYSGWIGGFMIPDAPTLLRMRLSALYDILNDSYDVTERKTGSLICRLAMAISNSPVGTFFSCSWLHSRSTAESRSAAHVSISGISGKDSDYWHIVYRLCSLSAVILLRAAKALKRFGEFCVFGLRNRPWQTCACVGSRCSRKHIIVALLFSSSSRSLVTFLGGVA